MRKSNYLMLCSLLSLTLYGCNTPVDPSTSSNESVNPSVEPSENVSSEEISSSDVNSSESEEDSSMEESEKPTPEPSPSVSEEVIYEVNENFDFISAGFMRPTVEAMEKLPSYKPTTFNENTFKLKETTKLGEGVDLKVYNYQLNTSAAGKDITPYVVEVDLTKANIVAGSYNNTTDPAEFAHKSVPIKQAVAWRNDNRNKQFYAVTNADFFGSTVVNAFVKDGVIMKDSHFQDLNDVPVSKPMLFGVSSAGARIAPISTIENYNDNLASSLRSEAVSLFNEDGQVIDTYRYSVDSGLGTSGIGLLYTQNRTKQIAPGNDVYKVKLIQKDKWESPKAPRGCIVEKLEDVKSVRTKDGYGYLVVGKEDKANISFEIGTYLAVAINTVISDGNEWNYYDTILGCRHSLVENGALAPTVSKETSNGSAYRVPRTAVGIKDDGKVIIVSVEDLHYNKKNGVDLCTGLNLTQLADFMRYIGCYDAANFDGGGSSQLTINKNGSYIVKTRSSDTGASVADSTRPVMNTIIVTSK